MLEMHNLRKREFATVGAAVWGVLPVCGCWSMLCGCCPFPYGCCWWLSVHAKLAADGLQARMH